MENKEILVLIERGFKPETISYEFNIPYEQIQKVLLEKEERASKRETEMDKIRRRYFEIYDPEDMKVRFKVPSVKQLASYIEADRIIDEIEQKSKNVDEKSKKDKRTTLIEMLNDLKTLDKYRLSFDQIERLVFIIEDKKWENLSLRRGDKINILLSKARSSISSKMSLALSDELKEVTDLDGLQNIRARIARISRETKSANYRIGVVDSNISQQIQKINLQRATYNLRNNISPAIEALIKSTANGTMNIEEANKIIDQESERRIKSGVKSKFSLSKEQQKRQVTIQIRTLLSERGDIYPIQDPNKALEDLSQLSKDVDRRQLFNIVAQNMLAQRRYDELATFCDQFIQTKRFDEVESEISKTAREKKKEIAYKKIGDMVVDRIKTSSNEQEDEIFIKLLKDKLTKENIALTKIKLGRIKGGSKEITLAEIMPQIRNR